MSTELFIHSTTDDSAVLALVKNGKLTELLHQDADNSFSVGDVYLGKVKKIASGLNAAFVEVGYDKDAFLHYHDLGPQVRSSLSYTKKVQQGKQHSNLIGFKNQPLIKKDGKIEDVLQPGQDIVVQIAKEPISTKGPRITSELSIAGRYIVLVPFSNRISVSQKIKEKEEKDRLREIATSLQPPNFGIIIRTVAQNRTVEELETDLKNLLNKWKTKHRNIKRAKAPFRLLREMDRASAFLRDVMDDSFERIVVDDEVLAGEIKEFLEGFAPKKAEIVKLHSGKTTMFQQYGIDRQIKTSFGRSVSMVKGAYLIIEHTEAMHVIDVNSGNRTSSDEDQEANALAVNLIAAEEIARQLRLRDMGGIIVVDFIDMHKAENRRELYNTLKEIMKSDRAKHKILPPSKFGLVEITRQRVRPEMNVDIKDDLNNDQVESSIQLIGLLEQQFERIASATDQKRVFLHVHPFIEAYLNKGWFNPIAKQWSRKYKKKLKVVVRDAYKLLEYSFKDVEGNVLKLQASEEV
ncbi:MAG: ribonuclease E/G [Schleiferiaceae bacterium]|nr:ribonuclease E/G [Schleiferiaceae bacterium]